MRLRSGIVEIRLPPPQPTSDAGPEGDLVLAHQHELTETSFLSRVEAQGSDRDDRAGDVAAGGATPR